MSVDVVCAMHERAKYTRVHPGVDRGSIIQSTDVPRSRSLGRVDESVEGPSCSPQMRRAAGAWVGRWVGRGSIMQSTDVPRSQSLGWVSDLVEGPSCSPQMCRAAKAWVGSTSRSRVHHAVHRCAARPELGSGRRVGRESIMQSTDAPRGRNLGRSMGRSMGRSRGDDAGWVSGLVEGR
jgi:hypothetical protein